MCVFPRPGKPQKQMHNLSAAIGNMDRGIELSALLTPSAVVLPGADCGIGLYDDERPPPGVGGVGRDSDDVSSPDVSSALAATSVTLTVSIVEIYSTTRTVEA
jgi:hypothetical protein